MNIKHYIKTKLNDRRSRCKIICKFHLMNVSSSNIIVKIATSFHIQNYVFIKDSEATTIIQINKKCYITTIGQTNYTDVKDIRKIFMGIS